MDVAFGVNGGQTRLYRNAGATPGLRVPLEGPPSNPRAIGARLRLEYADGTLGPAREVRSGEGYLAHHESTQTLGMAGAARVAPAGGDAPVRHATLHVVWSNGERTSVSLAPGTLEVRVRFAGTEGSTGS